MAKSDQPSLLERHIEKGVLGVCVLILFIALLVWGVSSSRSLLLGTQKVKLDKANEVIRNQALRKKAQADAKEPPDIPLVDYLAEVKKLLYTPLPKGFLSSWSQVTFALPPRNLPDKPAFEPWPERRVTQSLPSVARLEEVLKDPTLHPDMPEGNIDRELLFRARDPLEGIAGHFAATFPVGRLKDRWSRALGKSVPFIFVPVAVELERQELLPDGTWGHKGKTDEVMRVQTVTADEQGAMKLAPAYKELVPPFDGTEASKNNVRQAVKKLTAGASLTDLLQPQYGKILWPTGQFGSWLFRLPENKVTRPAIDADTKKQGDAAKSDETRIWTDESAEGRRREPPDRARAEEIRSRTGQTDSTRDSGYGAPPPRRAKPEAQPGPGETQVPSIPAMDKQLAKGDVLVWFHDTSVTSRGKYRYRWRLALVNPLLTYAGEAADQADARQRFITTQWSPWSEIASVPEITEFFVIGGDAKENRATVTVFTQVRGRTVKATFSRAPGQAVSEERTITIETDRIRESRKVKFDTGTVVVSLDFKRVVRDKIPRDTVEMIYLDDKGELKRAGRIADMDRDSEEYKQYLTLMDRSRG